MLGKEKEVKMAEMSITRRMAETVETTTEEEAATAMVAAEKGTKKLVTN
jgi:hypothetical protein